jgi:cell filamentation protein, protein adenylyltransferase
VDLEALRDSPIGQLVPISGTDGRSGEHYDYFSYLANALPRSVELSSATWTAIAHAEATLARLDQAARQVPEPALLRRPALRREAQSTSALEGTFAPLDAVLESDVEERGQLSIDLREILNYVVAAEEAFSWIRERPLTSGMVENLQGILVQGTAEPHSDAGRLRDRHVFIGPKDAPIDEARFVPAPFGDQLRAGFEEWIAWVNDPPGDMPTVLQAALAHYQFETLHPFSDGNGRIGRLLIVLQLMRQGVLSHPILVVSPWFEARRVEYQDALLMLSQTGRWDDWVRFFATGVGASAATTHERVDALISWRDDALQRVRDAGVSGVAERVAGDLIGAPILRAAQVAKRHNVSHQGAMNALRRLAHLEIVTEETRNGRVSFRAGRVVQLLSR